MDKLTVEEQAELKKCSSDRLKLKLCEAGIDEKVVLTMDRSQLLNAAAEHKVKGVSMAERDLYLREQDLRFRQAEAAAREKAEAREEARWNAEMKFREVEAQRQHEYRKQDREWREKEHEEGKSLLNQTKKFAQAIKDIFPSMPTDSAELPSYLNNVENLFKLYEVPNELKSKLLLPHLTGKAKSIVSKLPLDALHDYDLVKQCMLTEFQITPRELRSRFINATKRVDESYTIFRSRLEITLSHYLKSRKATKVEELIDLLVADKMKDCLPSGALRYVLGLEGDNIFDSKKIATAVDIYSSNYNDDDSYKATSMSNLSLHDKFLSYGKKTNKQHFGPKHTSEYGASDESNAITVVKKLPNIGNSYTKTFVPTNKSVGQPSKGLCFVCKSDKHFIADCPEKRNSHTSAAQSNACIASTNTPVVFDCDAADRPNLVVDCNATNCERHIVFDMVSGPYNTQADINMGERKPNLNASSMPELIVSPLKYIDIVISGKTYKALIDSGAQVPLIKSSLIDENISYIGNLNIQPIVGNAVQAKLAVLDIARFDYDEITDAEPKGDDTRPLHLVFAVTDLASHDVVLPETVAEQLVNTSHKYMSVCKNTDYKMLSDADLIIEYGTPNNHNSKQDIDCNVICDDVINVDSLEIDEVTEISTNVNNSRQQLIDDQISDKTLEACRSLAERHKGGYKNIDGLLYHYDKVLNQSVLQIVAPLNHRNDIMSFAHDTSYHQGHKNTCERIWF